MLYNIYKIIQYHRTTVCNFIEEVILRTLSKCPGRHPILHGGLKLNSKNSAGEYLKIELTGAS